MTATIAPLPNSNRSAFCDGLVVYAMVGAALTALAARVDKDVAGAKDGARVKTMASEIRRLAAVSK